MIVIYTIVIYMHDSYLHDSLIMIFKIIRNNKMTKFTRRNFLIQGASALAAPAIVNSSVFASSGELNLYTWQGYYDKAFIQGFTRKTGIKVNHTTFGSNDEVFAKLKSNGGSGYDLAMPTLGTLNKYYEAGLTQSIDEKRINFDDIIESVYDSTLDQDGTHNGKLQWIPAVWGSEGMTVDTSVVMKKEVGFEDLFSGEWGKRITARPKSLLISAMRLHNPDLAKRYQDKAFMDKSFAEATKYIISKKEYISNFWTNGTESSNAFKEGNAVIGQTWDGVGITLSKEDSKYQYRCPSEGAYMWIDGFVIPKGAKNTDQSYTWLNYINEGRAGGMMAESSGYNSASATGADFLSAESKKIFNKVYSKKDLEKLWIWPADPSWFNEMRQNYVNQYKVS